MTLQARSWLPDGALDDDVLLARVQGVAEAWSAYWMPLPRVHTDQVADPAGLSDTPDALRLAAPDGRVRAGASLASRLHLGMAMLGVSVDRNQVGADDQSLLDALASRALQDLVDRLGATPGADAGGPDGAYEPGPVFQIVLAEAGPRIEIALARDLAIAWRKGPAMPTSPRTSAGCWQDAVGDQPVRIGARVGDSSLSLAEMSSLEVGDVLVLDRVIGEGLEITVDGEPVRDQLCHVEQNGAQTSLRIGA